MARQKKIYLDESEMPKQWYNLAPDLPTPMNPPLGPDGNPVNPEMLAPVFPMNLIEQEVSQERWIDIPEEIRQILFQWRPSPLIRAYETGSSFGNSGKNLLQKRRCFASRKPQTQYSSATSLVQQTIRHQKTGNRNWCRPVGIGSFVCLRPNCGIECKVYMVRVSFDQKPFRKNADANLGWQMCGQSEHGKRKPDAIFLQNILTRQEA